MPRERTNSRPQAPRSLSSAPFDLASHRARLFPAGVSRPCSSHAFGSRLLPPLYDTDPPTRCVNAFWTRGGFAFFSAAQNLFWVVRGRGRIQSKREDERRRSSSSPCRATRRRNVEGNGAESELRVLQGEPDAQKRARSTASTLSWQPLPFSRSEATRRRQLLLSLHIFVTRVRRQSPAKSSRSGSTAAPTAGPRAPTFPERKKPKSTVYNLLLLFSHQA